MNTSFWEPQYILLVCWLFPTILLFCTRPFLDLPPREQRLAVCMSLGVLLSYLVLAVRDLQYRAEEDSILCVGTENGAD